MIIDKRDHILKYSPLLPNLNNGLTAVERLDSLEEGRYEFEGGYFMIQKGTTKPMEEGTFEAHQAYIDVQILLKGCEELAWNEISGLQTVIPYAAEKDVVRLQGEKIHHMMITEGMFYAVFPHDGHLAVSHLEESHSYTKLVMKLKLE